MTDLSVFDLVNEGITLVIKHPLTGEPMELDDGTPVSVQLVGPDSAEWKAAQRAMIDKRLAGAKGNKEVTAEEIEAESITQIASVVKGWTGMVHGTVAFQYPHDTRMLLTKFPHLRRQIDQHLAKSENFLRASVKG